MEGFIRFARRAMCAVMLLTFAARMAAGLRAGGFGAALKDAFAYATFMTLVLGLLCAMIWVAVNAVLAVRARRPRGA